MNACSLDYSLPQSIMNRWKDIKWRKIKTDEKYWDQKS